MLIYYLSQKVIWVESTIIFSSIKEEIIYILFSLLVPSFGSYDLRSKVHNKLYFRYCYNIQENSGLLILQTGAVS